MTQPGPPTEQMRVLVNHDLFVAVRADDHRPITDRLMEVLAGLELSPSGPFKDRTAPFRQGASVLKELAILPSRQGWVAVVPAWSDEEFLGLLGQRLSVDGQSVAVVWHMATGYHSVARFMKGQLTRYVALYSGDLVHATGQPLPTETYDMDDFRSRLLDAPDALQSWLDSQGIDPMADRTRCPEGAPDLLIVEVARSIGRAEVCQRYLDEVDPHHPEALEGVSK